MYSVREINILPSRNVFVGWRWDWDGSEDENSIEYQESEDDQDQLNPAQNQSDSTDSSEESNSACGDSNSQASPDQFSSSLMTHTVMFKCIGVTRDQEFQDTLSSAHQLLRENTNVPVRLVPEPNNLFDSKAIAFECQLDSKWRKIGYVVHEALEETHAALTHGDILNVRFGWIKYITDWYMSGPGFFAGINVSKKGSWFADVIRCGSTRLH